MAIRLAQAFILLKKRDEIRIGMFKKNGFNKKKSKTKKKVVA
jgi:hypothetical protein